MRRHLAPLACLAFAALLAVAASCDDDGSQGANGTPGGDAGGDKITAVTTLELFADMVRNVGGDRVEVNALLPSGTDAHTFELAPDRVADIARADVVFVNGLDLEGNVVETIEANAGGAVVELSDGLDVLEGGEEHEDDEHEDGDDHAQGNPHLWLDVTNAEGYVENIRDALIVADPSGREAYGANASAYMEELSILDASFNAAVRSIPEENRKLVTFHDAFPYLAQRYGLQVVAVVVPSPGQEPSAQDVADLTRTLRDQNVPAVFREPQFNNDVLELAASEADVQVLELVSDAYTEGVDSYVSLMEFNMTQLTEGLGGD